MDELKVKIEDDPFYFKKYVFVYNDAQADEFKKLCKQYGQTASKLIQTYILDTENFNKFKKNGDNEKYINWFRNYLLKSRLFRLILNLEGK